MNVLFLLFGVFLFVIAALLYNNKKRIFSILIGLIAIICLGCSTYLFKVYINIQNPKIIINKDTITIYDSDTLILIIPKDTVYYEKKQKTERMDSTSKKRL